MVNGSSNRLVSEINVQMLRYFAVYVIAFVFAYTSVAKISNYTVYSSYVLHELTFLPKAVLDFALVVPFLEFIVASTVFFQKTRKIALMVAALHFMLMSVFWLYATVASKSIGFSRSLAGMMSRLNNIEHLYFNLALLLFVITTFLLNSLQPRLSHTRKFK